ncbi:YhgE/Pip domain-containing protein [Thermoflavimicrobium dichotomicum]|uniref:YhgE/Pip N-terminal domain-containing protein/YhgE/Pip C-terminal domain-containing protein n=1 Tax=Thermoflavimicrobium dichotomicum TaxID=46223 RepID=A0A1I3NKQ7_9BACL|nr:ABC transporter permease [Thermoflavimicrobium dichotomicum]SFJ09769.1 YhgE/Pip N-terminal domain-containing protein/YhgE/Pip C-terminal domain-containing protein [Thermoflavimicrobium dichotomicum]
MQKAFMLYLKKPTTWIGFVIALLFQVIFSVVWLTAYDGVLDRSNQLKVGIVNEDPLVGKKIAEQLTKQLDFQITHFSSLEEAKRQLEARKEQLVIFIPHHFSQKIGSGAQLEYLINESNSMMVKNVMQNVSTKITAMVNEQLAQQAVETALAKANVPGPQAKKMASGLVGPVTGKVHRIHPVDNLAKQMTPMMLVLASYVGSMLLSLQLHQSSKTMTGQVSKWADFLARVAINVIASFLVSLVGSSLIMEFSGAETGFFSLWMFQMMMILTFLGVAQAFLYLLQEAGMFVNIALLSLQLATSGSMVPREMLSPFYQAISEYLPATYAVDGAMNLLFGGRSVSDEIRSMLMILGCAFLLIILCVGFLRKEAVEKKRSLEEAS